MRSCQGALLVIDSTQGIQAQTLSNFDLAIGENLKILPILNKIDMIGANVEDVS
jgi:translation elongation factor EF-4